MIYFVKYDLQVGTRRIQDTMPVEAVSEERAIEFCGQLLDQKYNQGENENDVTLLSAEVVATRED